MKGLEICYEDSELIIVNKPSGLLVIPDRFDEHAPTLKKQIEAYLGTKVFTVHRIDKDTSGVICFLTISVNIKLNISPTMRPRIVRRTAESSSQSGSSRCCSSVGWRR
jgi:23S rRNA-/tRNA-specific pseudouridylate synthase